MEAQTINRLASGENGELMPFKTELKNNVLSDRLSTTYRYYLITSIVNGTLPQKIITIVNKLIDKINYINPKSQLSSIPRKPIVIDVTEVDIETEGLVQQVRKKVADAKEKYKGTVPTVTAVHVEHPSLVGKTLEEISNL